MEYRPRVADAAMTDLLAALGGVLVEGPRGCGKTTTALQHARSQIRLDSGPNVLELASLDPAGLLAGAAPRLVDEWQLAPTLWNVVRHEIDARREPGQFILSGSSTPMRDPSRHSGAGRLGRLRMRPMTLAESGRSSQVVSLADLESGEPISGRSQMAYRDLAEAAIVGGWPVLLRASHRQAVAFNRSYLDDLCASAIPLATGVRHDPVRLRRLLESVARNIASEATLESLAADVSADGGAFDPKTARTYLDALVTVFALDELPAWSVALRSRSRLRTSPKLHLADPALACAALGVNADRLAKDPEFFGQVFESLVTRDLRSMVEARFGRAYHYRDNTGLEVDIILEFEDRTWAAIEVKLGASRIAEAEKSLLMLRDARVDLNRVGPPAFLAVVTGTEYAYTLPSGVHVVPLAALAS
jgi:predicted AAA+ superfamily ATPase